MSRIRLLVGLGNPGPSYSGTRHNLGFDWIEALARRWKTELKPWKGLGELGSATAGDLEVWLAKPLTFMNESGRMVAPLMKAKGLEPSEVLVGLDELALPLGRVRLRPRGSDGGHHGMASILEKVGSASLARLRMGIGPLPSAADPVAFVLGRFRPEERPAAKTMLERACDAAERAVLDGLERAMTSFNVSPG